MTRQLRAALTGINCGVLIVDDGRVELLNPALRALFGLDDDEVYEGRPLAEVVAAEATAAEDPIRFAARLAELATGTEPVNEDVVTADGRVLEREYLPVVTDGVRTGHVSLYWDVSAGRAADLDRLRRQRAEIIAQQMGVRAQRTRAAEAERAGRSLAERNRVLAATDERRKDLLATASHELRTPLTSILSFSELLVDGGVGAPDTRQYAEIIHRNAVALLDIVEDLLLLATLGSAVHPRKPEILPVAELLERARLDLAVLAGAGGVSLSVRADDDTVVAGDRDALARVLANVVGNAVKYSEPGGTVLVHATRDDSGAGAGPDVGEVRIEVVDDGIGIPEDEVDQVFGQFFRASTARRSGRPGTGLGLAIARSIVTQHGGTIALRSTVGQGTTVTLRLPAEHRPTPG